MSSSTFSTSLSILVLGFLATAGCGDDSSSNTAGVGAAGSLAPAGTGAGATGVAGTGAGGAGSAGTGVAGTGVAGTGVAGTGVAGTGVAGTGVAGTGVAGTGAAGTPAAGSGAGGCGSESFAAIYRDILASPTYSCSSAPCHGRVGMLPMVGNLDLSTPAVAYTALVKTSDSTVCAGKPRVTPGNAAGSLLVTKLRDATVDCGTLMPVGGDPITDPELARIVAWINGGACNN